MLSELNNDSVLPLRINGAIQDYGCEVSMNVLVLKQRQFSNSVCQSVVRNVHFSVTDDSVEHFSGFLTLILLRTPAQRKRASMLYFANVFLYFFYGRLILRPW